MSTLLLTVAVQAEHDLVLVRQRTRQLTQQLGVDRNRQTRLATAVSEITRNAYQYAGEGKVEFLVERAPAAKMLVRIRDSGPGVAQLEAIMEGRYRSTTGLGMGLAGARRLVDYFEIDTKDEQGTSVVLGVDLPEIIADDQELLDLVDLLTRTSPGNPFGEVLQQNQELLRTQNELSEANRELEAAQSAKDRFLAMLAHELRNLLNALRSSMAVLRRRPDEATRERMENVADLQVKHLERLIDDLLDASRILRGTLELQRQPIDVAAEIKSTAAAWREQLEQRGLTFSTEVPEAPTWVSADPTRLAQIIGNLISNAGKFTDAGDAVAIKVETAGENALIQVIDNGCGMEPENLSKAFEPFSQSAEARRRMTGGLGLGLAIVKALVEAHGGELQATSEGTGKGLAVSLQLPLGEPPPAEDGSPAEASGQAASRRILLVDDHAPSIISLSELLRLDGHVVEVANDGPQALEVAAVFQPEVILCDLGLPDMDGNEVARQLAKWPGSMRLVAVSGFVDQQSRQEALEAGFERVLAKPVDFDLLTEILTRSDSDN